jgi:hypothetical protein
VLTHSTTFTCMSGETQGYASIIPRSEKTSLATKAAFNAAGNPA